MSTISEIDKAGRVVVPKKLREVNHLLPGTPIVFHQHPEGVLIKPAAHPRGLYMKKGTLVYDAGPLPPINSLDWIEDDRQARMDQIVTWSPDQ
jgi:AbrB family looped-hinge helix DNA binding protein